MHGRRVRDDKLTHRFAISYIRYAFRESVRCCHLKLLSAIRLDEPPRRAHQGVRVYVSLTIFPIPKVLTFLFFSFLPCLSRIDGSLYTFPALMDRAILRLDVNIHKSGPVRSACRVSWNFGQP